MRLLLKLFVISAYLALAGAELSAKSDAKGDAKSDSKDDSGKSKDSGKKKKSKDKKPADSAKADGTDPAADPAAAKTKARITIPLVPGHVSKGLRVPYYDAQGKLKMIFNIGEASRLDQDNVKMIETQVNTFTDDGAPEYTINLPASVLNEATRVVTSQTETTIRREDFILTGDSVEFNTATQEGKLVGHIHMVIYNLDTEMGDKTPAVELKPNE